MSSYQPDWNPSSISDDVVYIEVGKRMSAKRRNKSNGGNHKYKGTQKGAKYATQRES